MQSVLLVEDNSDVRRVIRLMLQKMGHQVLEAAEVTEAVRLFEQRPDAVDLLITDVVLPRPGCAAMVEQLKRKRRSLKVLYMSGYLEDVTARFGLTPASANFLSKPFTADVLARKIARLLNGNQSKRRHLEKIQRKRPSPAAAG